MRSLSRRALGLLGGLGWLAGPGFHSPASATGAPDAGTEGGGQIALPVLTLFDLELQKATASDLRGALRKAGAKPRKSARGSGGESYDVKAIGLPGLEGLEVIFHQGAFVAAIYRGLARPLERRGEEEKMRKMLFEKYGAPNWFVGEGPLATEKGPLRHSFTERHVTDGKYGWEFAGGMQLVFRKRFGGLVELTYVDPRRFAALKELATQADAADTRARSHEKRHAF